MLEATLASLRKSSDFLKSDEIIHIVDGRKKEEIGFFVPKSMKEEFASFLAEMEQKRKKALLQRVAKAQRKDPIREGSVGDNIG